MTAFESLFRGIPQKQWNTWAEASEETENASPSAFRQWLIYGVRFAIFFAISYMFRFSAIPFFVLLSIVLVYPFLHRLIAVNRAVGLFWLYQCVLISLLIFISFAHEQNLVPTRYYPVVEQAMLALILGPVLVIFVFHVITSFSKASFGVITLFMFTVIQFISALYLSDELQSLVPNVPLQIFLPSSPAMLPRYLLGNMLIFALIVVASLISGRKQRAGERKSNLGTIKRLPRAIIVDFVFACASVFGETIALIVQAILGFFLRVCIPALIYVVVTLALIGVTELTRAYFLDNRYDYLLWMILALVLSVFLMLFFCTFLSSAYQEQPKLDLSLGWPRSDKRRLLWDSHAEFSVNFLFIYPATMLTLYIFEVQYFEFSLAALDPLFLSTLVVILLIVVVVVFEAARGMNSEEIKQSQGLIDTLIDYWFVLPFILGVLWYVPHLVAG